ncbi:MAG: hypothetical protein GY940_46235 [bacterium]|nr:hypothetical protein [bacterium]
MKRKKTSSGKGSAWGLMLIAAVAGVVGLLVKGEGKRKAKDISDISLQGALKTHTGMFT